MSRIFQVFILSMLMSIISMESQAKLFGISINFKKGVKEWNATKTETECVGRGLCELSFSADYSGQMAPLFRSKWLQLF